MATSQVGLVAKLVDIVRGVPKEKVVRVALATLRNLLGAGNAASDMVGCGIMKVLGSLQHRKWADEDILEDIEHLNQALQVNVLSMSSWDMYAKEARAHAADSPCACACAHSRPRARPRALALALALALAHAHAHAHAQRATCTRTCTRTRTRMRRALAAGPPRLPAALLSGGLREAGVEPLAQVGELLAG